MNRDEILGLASMPASSPTYPRGPYYFYNRQYLVVSYRTDPGLIRAALPEPLEPEGDVVSVQWIDMPDGSGFGAYAATAQTIPCRYAGKPLTFIAQMYTDNCPPAAGGREIWGYPMKFGKPKLEVEKDTLVGTLTYSGQMVATGSMVYKHDSHKDDAGAIAERLTRTQVNLKIIPDVDGTPAIAQLVAYEFQDVTVKGAWTGRARLDLHPSVNAPLADLPVLSDATGSHMMTDLVLPYGRILHDYLAK